MLVGEGRWDGGNLVERAALLGELEIVGAGVLAVQRPDLVPQPTHKGMGGGVRAVLRRAWLDMTVGGIRARDTPVHVVPLSDPGQREVLPQLTHASRLAHAR